MPRPTDPGTALLRRVRDAVAEDDLATALDWLEDLADDGAAPLDTADEVLLARRRLSRLNADERAGRLTQEQCRVERGGIGSQVLALARRFDPAPALSPRDLKARARYLEAVRDDLNKRRRASLHQAVLLDLGLDTAAGTTRLPWDHVDAADDDRTYSGGADAFEQHRERLLILGDPGAGKTVSLLRLAEEMLQRAAADPDAPVPLVVNLSGYRPATASGAWGERFRGLLGWRDRGAAEPVAAASPGQTAPVSGDLERWLAEEMARYRVLSVGQARRWLAEGRVAIFFDGLDEVSRSTAIWAGLRCSSAYGCGPPFLRIGGMTF